MLPFYSYSRAGRSTLQWVEGPPVAIDVSPNNYSEFAGPQQLKANAAAEGSPSGIQGRARRVVHTGGLPSKNPYPTQQPKGAMRVRRLRSTSRLRRNQEPVEVPTVRPFSLIESSMSLSNNKDGVQRRAPTRRRRSGSQDIRAEESWDAPTSIDKLGSFIAAYDDHALRRERGLHGYHHSAPSEETLAVPNPLIPCYSELGDFGLDSTKERRKSRRLSEMMGLQDPFFDDSFSRYPRMPVPQPPSPAGLESRLMIEQSISKGSLKPRLPH